MGENKPLKIRTRYFLLAVFFVVCYLTSFYSSVNNARAADLTQRNISVSSGQQGAVAQHAYSFTYGSVSSVGSVAFEYCENTPVFGQPCDPPVGLDLSGAVLSSQTGNTGFNIDIVNSSANKIVLTRPAVASAAVASTYVFGNIINPTNAPHSEFIQIGTHASADGSGPRVDSGSVAYAVLNPLNVAAYIPPFLNFCVGITVALDCSSTLGNSIDLGVISTSAVNSATSQFSTATNDGTGYVVSILGNTMTSGNNIIPSLPAPFPSLVGTSAFGFNLRANSNPAKGQNPIGTGTGVQSTDYSFPNFFKFLDGDVIASSNLSSDYTRMTTTYMINAASSQAPGVYSATLTYVATVQF